MRSASRRWWEGPLLWGLWGMFMGVGLLSILSIGFLILVAGLALLVPLARRRVPGAWMALVGAGIPLALFALQGIISPDCARGRAVSTPSGGQRFTCDEIRARTELVPVPPGIRDRDHHRGRGVPAFSPQRRSAGCSAPYQGTPRS